jgi:hypothetical protein
VIRFADAQLGGISADVQSPGAGAIYHIASSDDRVWVAGRDSGTIWEFARSGDLLAEHELPAVVIPGEDIFCPRGADCEDVVVSRTRVEGLAVAPDGTLYFSDGTKNRIGVIRPTGSD